jgi:tetratricopeptide (TPR) repeat protein
MWANFCSAQTKSPQDTLKQYISDLQKNPNDDALREKIIKHVQTMKSKPSIPEEARRHFVKGMTFQKEAKSASDYELAIKAYEEALLSAPWWPEAYNNLALSQEAAGRFDDGIRSLMLYLMTKPKDAEKVRNRMYAMEAKEEKAAKNQEEFIHGLAGAWYAIGRTDYRGDLAERERIFGRDYYQMSITGRNAFSLTLTGHRGGIGTPIPGYSETYTGTVSGTRISGYFSKRDNYTEWKCGMVDFSGTFDGTISADGRTMRVTTRGLLGFNVDTCSKLDHEFTREFTKD